MAGFPRMIKAVFLDAGNTLLASDPPVDEVYARSFAAHGVVASRRDVHHAVHETWRDVAERRLVREDRWADDDGELGFWRRFVQAVYSRVGGGALPPALLAGLVEHFAHESHWSVYPDVPETLAELRALGLKLVVVSNWDSTLPRLLARLALDVHFDAVVVSAVVGKSKPAREIFDVALRLAGVAAAEALHVGDSAEDDYDGARAAGLAALLLDRHARAGDGYERIATLAELPSRVRKGLDPSLRP